MNELSDCQTVSLYLHLVSSKRIVASRCTQSLSAHSFEHMGDSAKRRADSGNDLAGRKKSKVSQRTPTYAFVKIISPAFIFFTITSCYKEIDRFADQCVIYEAMENAQKRSLLCACEH